MHATEQLWRISWQFSTDSERMLPKIPIKIRCSKFYREYILNTEYFNVFMLWKKGTKYIQSYIHTVVHKVCFIFRTVCQNKTVFFYSSHAYYVLIQKEKRSQTNSSHHGLPHIDNLDGFTSISNLRGFTRCFWLSEGLGPGRGGGCCLFVHFLIFFKKDQNLSQLILHYFQVNLLEIQPNFVLR